MEYIFIFFFHAQFFNQHLHKVMEDRPQETGNCLSEEPISPILSQGNTCMNMQRCVHKMLSAVQSKIEENWAQSKSWKAKEKINKSWYIHMQWPLLHHDINGLYVMTRADVRDTYH